MNNKYKNTKLVTFKEDYFSKPQQGKGEPIYTKGSTHAIHKDTVAALEKKGASMTVKDYPYEKKLAEAKKAFEEAKAE